MNPPPSGWPRISSALFYREPIAAIDWLVRALGFEVRIKVVGDDGALHHSELTRGGGVVMVSSAAADPSRRSPAALGGGNTQALMIYVDGVDALCQRARAAGAKVISEPKDTDYGAEYWCDRGCEIEDPEGHRFWLVQRLRTAGE